MNKWRLRGGPLGINSLEGPLITDSNEVVLIEKSQYDSLVKIIERGLKSNGFNHLPELKKEAKAVILASKKECGK